MKDNRWIFVIPPDGAARTVALNISDAFKTIIPIEYVKIFDTFKYLSAFRTMLKNPDPDTTVDLLNQTLVVSSLDFGTTHILSGALSPLTLFTLNLLRKQGITTIHWFYEDYHKASYWKDVISGYDHFCAIQKGILPSECQKAGSKYHYLPTATSCVFQMQQSERRFDIAFIGIPSPYRISILEHLACEGFHLLIAGSGWGAYEGILKKNIISGTWVDNDISFSLLNQSKIGLNISIENPSGRSDVHISPRAFDILASGCILLTEKVPLIDDTIPLCKYHTFSSIKDAVIKADKILNNYQNESITSKQNIEIITSQHTYKNRATDILNYLN